MDFSLCVKIDDTVLISLAVYDALAIDDVDGAPVQRDEFAHTHARGTQQVDQGKVSGRSTIVAKDLNDLITICFLYGLRRLDSFDASNWALNDMVFVLEL